jgi:hypothetical protein
MCNGKRRGLSLVGTELEHYTFRRIFVTKPSKGLLLACLKRHWYPFYVDSTQIKVTIYFSPKTWTDEASSFLSFRGDKVLARTRFLLSHHSLDFKSMHTTP